MTKAVTRTDADERPGNHVIVLFGATGDLARRKLLPGPGRAPWAPPPAARPPAPGARLAHSSRSAVAGADRWLSTEAASGERVSGNPHLGAAEQAAAGPARQRAPQLTGKVGPLGRREAAGQVTRRRRDVVGFDPAQRGLQRLCYRRRQRRRGGHCGWQVHGMPLGRPGQPPRSDVAARHPVDHVVDEVPDVTTADACCRCRGWLYGRSVGISAARSRTGCRPVSGVGRATDHDHHRLSGVGMIPKTAYRSLRSPTTGGRPSRPAWLLQAPL
jgi:hypothetical protein